MPAVQTWIRFLEDCTASDTGEKFAKDTAVTIDEDEKSVWALVKSGKAEVFDPDDKGSGVMFVKDRGGKSDDDDDDSALAAQKATKRAEKIADDARKAAEDEVQRQLSIKGKQPSRPHVEITGRRGSEKEGHETFGFRNMSAFKRMLFHQSTNRMTADEARQFASIVEYYKVPSGASEGVDAEGGVLVPTEYRSELLQKIYEGGEILQRCRRIQTNSNALAIPYIHETSRADGSRWGGVRAYWRSEAEQMTKSKPSFGRLELQLEKITALFYATDELIEDSTLDIGSLTTPMFIQELTFKLENAIFNGTGAGQPLGLLNANATVEKAKESGQTLETIQFENIVGMWARMWARSRGNSVWFINNDTIPQLFTMSQTLNVPVFPVGTIPGDSGIPPLLGRPVIAVEHCATLGTVGDIILADMSQFVVAEKATGPQTAASMHLRFDYGEMVFRWTWRVNGAPWWESALTPKTGSSNTLSPFVTLATRS